MRTTLAIALSIVASACGGIPENEFIIDYEEAFCATYELCATEEMKRTVREKECHQHMRGQAYPEPPDCTYDREKAEECVAALEARECDGVNPLIPEPCDQVYTGCAYPRVQPVR